MPAIASPAGFQATTVAQFVNPSALSFLPDGRMLVADGSADRIYVVTQTGVKSPVTGLPSAERFVQNIFLDIVVQPSPAPAGQIYYSLKDAHTGSSTLTLKRATLLLDGCPALSSITGVFSTINLAGRSNGSEGGRIAYDLSGHVYLSSGAEATNTQSGYVRRFNADGTIPSDNPFTDVAGNRTVIWASGMRSPYGLAFDALGQLWESEIGAPPSSPTDIAQDEINLIERAGDYRQPDGRSPAISWNLTVAPSGLIFYSGSLFTGWTGDALVGGQKYLGLIRLRPSGATMTEAQRIPLGIPVQDVEQGPDGALWVLEKGANGRLIHLTPN